jgi:TP901 family phage tail tape measure protein
VPTVAELILLITGKDQASSVLNGIGASAQKLGPKFTQAGVGLSLGLTTPILGVGGASLKMGVDFNNSLTQITALVGTSKEQVDTWKGDILDLSKATAVGPGELADALYFVTSSGASTSDAMDILTASARASAAGLGNTGIIADAVTSAINAYGSENLSASQATDTLVAAVREGKVEADELAPVLGRLLPTSSALGISFQDVAGVLAVMSRTGLDASEASTSLNAIMSTLLKPSKEASDTLADAGLSMDQLRKTAAGPDGLIGVMKLLNDHFGDNEEQLAKILPNVRAFRGVMNVLAQDAGTVDTVMQGVADSTGDTNKAFGAVTTSDGFKFKQFLNDLQVEGTKLGDTLAPALVSLLPVLSGVIGALAKGVDIFTRLPAPLQTAIVVFLLLVATLGPLLVILGTMASAFAALVAIAPVVGAAFTVMLGPVGLVILALAALALGVYLAYQHWDQISAAAQGAMDAVSGAINGALTWVRNNWPIIVTILSGPFAPLVALATDAFGVRSALTGAVSGALDWLSKNWPIVATVLSGPFAPLVALATDAFGVRTAFVNGITGIFTWLGDNWAKVLTVISGPFTGPFIALATDAFGVRSAVIGGLQDLWNWITRNVSSIASAIEKPFTDVDWVGVGQRIILDIIKGISGYSVAAAIASKIPGSSQAANIVTGALGLIPGRAVGGPVMGGSPYMVGENGPELFVPGSSGRIVPNGAGGGLTVNFNGPVTLAPPGSPKDQLQTVGFAVASTLRRRGIPMLS